MFDAETFGQSECGVGRPSHNQSLVGTARRAVRDFSHTRRAGPARPTRAFGLRRKLLVGCIGLIGFTSCATRGRNELPSSSPRAEQIHEALNQTVIPFVDLENVSIEDALKFWSEKSRELHPLHFQFKYVIQYPMVYTSGSSINGGPTVTANPVRMKTSVTVHRKNITSERLLDEICGQANFQWRIMGRVIVVKPSGTAAAGSS